jgi:hypothetical protein
MSKNTLLVMPSVIKDRTGIHTNIDDKLLYPEIKAAQDMYILPLLGSNLFHKIQNDIEDNTLTGDYKDLMDDYIIDAIINYVLAELPDGLSNQFYNRGLSKKTGDDTQPLSMTEMYTIVSKYRNRAEHYAKRCRLYLVQNGSAKFPEYNQVIVGADSIPPDAVSFVSPIYLGTSRIEIKVQDNPGYNSNDPIYL